MKKLLLFTETIVINIGTPATVETTLLFLYGKKPKITSDNAETLMRLAEFFLIPNLKAACVAWFKAIEVTDKNCLKHLQQASLFNFELPECVTYLEGDVNELLLKEQHVEIDSQTVAYIFTERKFSYIPMDDKLKFLMRWAHVNPTSRLEKAQELAKCVNFSDISIELLKEVESDILYGEITKKNVPAEEKSENKYTEVLIMTDDNKSSFWCFDIERIRWFKLKTSLFRQRDFPFINIKGVSKSESTYYSEFMYCSSSYYDPSIIVCFNLETDIVQSYSMVKKDDSFPNFKHVEMYDSVCIASENKAITKNRISESDIGFLQRQNENQSMSVRGKKQLLMQDISLGLRTRSIDVETSIIYAGQVGKGNIDMEALFTIINGNVSKLCINSLYSIALMVHSKNRIFIYDMINCKLEMIEEPFELSDELCSSKEGFVIFNNKRCICLRKPQQTSSESKYKSESKYEKRRFEFGQTCKYVEFVRMFFVKDHWYRYVLKSRNETFQFEWIHYDKMLEAKDTETADWTLLPLPIDASKCYRYTLERPIFHIRVPKSMLKCDIECLHCEHLRSTWTNSRTANRAIDSDEEYLEGYDEYWEDVSSEDDFCERNAYNSDRDCFYDSN